MRSLSMPTADQALHGRSQSMPLPEAHHVNGLPLDGPFPANLKQAMFAMGCFWGAERLFWQQPGVYVTAVGYSGGITPNPTYDEVCTGMTGHAEVVRVVYDPLVVSYERLLKLFWAHHDPCQGMRQGNDVGTQYRSAIYTYHDVQYAAALLSRECYQEALAEEGYGVITTEIAYASPFYFAEPHHQQYLVTHPGGYCGMGGTGVPYPSA